MRQGWKVLPVFSGPGSLFWWCLWGFNMRGCNISSAVSVSEYKGWIVSITDFLTASHIQPGQFKVSASTHMAGCTCHIATTQHQVSWLDLTCWCQTFWVFPVPFFFLFPLLTFLPLSPLPFSPLFLPIPFLLHFFALLPICFSFHALCLQYKPSTPELHLPLLASMSSITAQTDFWGKY